VVVDTNAGVDDAEILEWIITNTPARHSSRAVARATNNRSQRSQRCSHVTVSFTPDPLPERLLRPLYCRLIIRWYGELTSLQVIFSWEHRGNPTIYFPLTNPRVADSSNREPLKFLFLVHTRRYMFNSPPIPSHSPQHVFRRTPILFTSFARLRAPDVEAGWPETPLNLREQPALAPHGTNVTSFGGRPRQADRQTFR
jgi:hypothetical protein